jgi:hypothetical protein
MPLNMTVAPASSEAMVFDPRSWNFASVGHETGRRKSRRPQGFRGSSRFFQTAGISPLSPEDQSAIREKMETFDAFTSDNDPRKERDFERSSIARAHFWKIDYCDTIMTKGSEDPSDLKQTVRVLTIMLASEY